METNHKNLGTSHQRSQYQDILERAGLNENEAKVYEILLDGGQLNIAKLQKLLPEIKRTNLYNVLYSLRDEGIVEQTIKNKKINFKAADPYKLRDLLHKRRQQIVESEAMIESIIPQMVSMYNLSTSKPAVRHYEGTKGLSLVYKELNNSGSDELLLIRSVYDDDHPDLKKVVEKQIGIQIKLGIKTQALTPLVSDTKMVFDKKDNERLVKRRIVKREMLFLPAQIMIWNNTVAISSMKGKLISTVIENKAIADTFRVIFKYIWSSSYKYHSEVVKQWGLGARG